MHLQIMIMMVKKVIEAITSKVNKDMIKLFVRSQVSWYQRGLTYDQQ